MKEIDQDVAVPGGSRHAEHRPSQ